MKDLYKFCKAEDIAWVIPGDVLKWLHESVTIDIVNLKDRPNGLGVFIKENVIVGKVTVHIGVVAMWTTKKDKLEIDFDRYHIFRGAMPDELLDDLNFVAKNTINPVWDKT